MYTANDIIRLIAKPDVGASRVNVAMLLIAIHMIYGGAY